MGLLADLATAAAKRLRIVQLRTAGDVTYTPTASICRACGCDTTSCREWGCLSLGDGTYSRDVTAGRNDAWQAHTDYAPKTGDTR